MEAQYESTLASLDAKKSDSVQDYYVADTLLALSLKPSVTAWQRQRIPVSLSRTKVN